VRFIGDGGERVRLVVVVFDAFLRLYIPPPANPPPANPPTQFLMTRLLCTPASSKLWDGGLSGLTR